MPEREDTYQVIVSKGQLINLRIRQHLLPD